ncbi:MAG: hypothetical protein K2X76_00880 [Sphingomonas sp.]|nr:hypothetical protein [Sphingomonas sp.]
MATVLTQPEHLFAPAARAPVCCQVDGCKRTMSFRPICEYHSRHAPGHLYGALLSACEVSDQVLMALAAERIARWYREESVGARVRRLIWRAPRAPSQPAGGTWLPEPQRRRMDEGYWSAITLRRCVVDGCNEAQDGFNPVCRKHFLAAPARFQGQILFGQELQKRGIITFGAGRIACYLSQEAKKPAPIRLTRRLWNILKGNRSTGELVLMLGGTFTGAFVLAIVAIAFMALEPLP